MYATVGVRSLVKTTNLRLLCMWVSRKSMHAQEKTHRHKDTPLYTLELLSTNAGNSGFMITDDITISSFQEQHGLIKARH